MSCLLYTSDAADDMQCVDLGGRRIIKKKNPSRKSGENFKLYESNYDLHLQKEEAFQSLLKNFISKAFFEMAQEANKEFSLKFKDKKIGVTITDSWFIQYEKGGFVLPHSHGQCSWCCVYSVSYTHLRAHET